MFRMTIFQADDRNSQEWKLQLKTIGRYYTRREDIPVVHMRHIIPGPDAPFFAGNSKGSEINNCVEPQNEERVIVKHFPSAFRETDLNGRLKDLDVNSLMICGSMSHMCVDTTVRAAFDLGYQCRVSSDACATRDLTHNDRLIRAADVHDAFMAALSSPFARVMTTDEMLQSN